MKRGVIVVLLLLLWTLPLTQPPNSTISNIQKPTETFAAAADGTESEYSINSFSSTLENDILHYPDLFLNTTPTTADSGVIYVGTETDGTYATTKVLAGTWTFSEGAGNDYNVSITVPIPVSIRGYKVAVYAWPNEETDTRDVNLEKDDRSFLDIGDMGWGGSAAWVNYTTYDSDLWNATHIRINCFVDHSGATTGFQWQYAEVQFYIMTLSDNEHFAESFHSGHK